MVKDKLKIGEDELDKFEQMEFTDDELNKYFGIPSLLNDEIPDVVDEGIKNLLDEYNIKTELRNVLDYKLRELYPYTQHTDDDLKKFYRLEKATNMSHWKRLEKDLKKLISNSYLCKFLNLKVSVIEQKLEGIQQFIIEYKEMGRSGSRKIMYPILGEIWAILAKNDHDRRNQIEFIYKFCVLSNFRSFGQRHQEYDPVLSKDLIAFKREDIDVIERWYDEARLFMCIPIFWGA